jgi:putative phosphoribosyl transferase
MQTDVRIQAGDVQLAGELALPADYRGVVLFVHGSGSTRFSPRNQFVGRGLGSAGFGTLLFELQTTEERALDVRSPNLARFDTPLLARRLVAATQWLKNQPKMGDTALGYYGASTGGGVVMAAAALMGKDISAVVSRGGYVDHAGDALQHVTAPTLMIVGSLDQQILWLNQDAHRKMKCVRRLEVVDGAHHLFEEAGKLDDVVRLASDWFKRYFSPSPAP